MPLRKSWKWMQKWIWTGIPGTQGEDCFMQTFYGLGLSLAVSNINCKLYLLLFCSQIQSAGNNALLENPQFCSYLYFLTVVWLRKLKGLQRWTLFFPWHRKKSTNYFLFVCCLDAQGTKWNLRSSSVVLSQFLLVFFFLLFPWETNIQFWHISCWP